MELNLTEIIVALIGTGAIGAAAAWFFGGKQANKNTINNDSHARECDFHNMVENENEKTARMMARVVSDQLCELAEMCKYKKNCPVIKSVNKKKAEIKEAAES